MKVELGIEREGILHQVKYQAFKTGECMKEGESESMATKIQPSDEDDELLNKFIDTAASEVTDILSGHLEQVSLEKADSVTPKGSPSVKFVLNLEVVSNYDNNQNEGLAEGIKDYMIAYTLFKWYRMTYPKLADPSELEKLASNINHRINQRTRPVRRPVLPLNF